jgi:UDP-3-O-[3-hydroxymyristoyl] N-acetylglucosamine deacetylase / 3-hydroxyacyl-[acyl-carrier-protein] dehydratase
MNLKQKTLRRVAIMKGIGAFTGETVTVEIRPAPLNNGPSFALIKDGKITPIPVSIENVIETENRTVLADRTNPQYQINFVEHILGALHGLEVDNAVIRMNSVEVPLIDGSALPFMKAIDDAGLVEQEEDRREIVIDKPLFIQDNALLLALPCDEFRVTYYLDEPDDCVGTHLVQIEITPENFRDKIGPARTFMKAEKVNDLVASGTVKHTNEEQILVVYKDRTNQPLRFEDEFCYHKILDILGDLYLMGKRIRGHIIGIRSGHYQNRKMVRKIAEEIVGKG